MTEYIQVDRDQLRVGMRFDYRFDGESFDQYERRITAISAKDGIEYDWVRPASGRNDHIATTWDEFEDRTFWVHPDDLYLNETAHDAAYEKGVRDGYLKAQQEQDTDERIAAWDELSKHPAFAEAYAEDAPLLDAIVARLNNLRADATRAQGAKPTGAPKHRDIRREDAVLWAVQALGGTPEAAHLLIPLAQQIERYVNGNDEQEAKAKAPELPTVIETAAQVALNWPEGTTVTDKDGDIWKRGDDAEAELGDRDGWLWGTWPHLPLSSYLPATVTRLGAE